MLQEWHVESRVPAPRNERSTPSWSCLHLGQEPLISCGCLNESANLRPDYRGLSGGTLAFRHWGGTTKAEYKKPVPGLRLGPDGYRVLQGISLRDRRA